MEKVKYLIGVGLQENPVFGNPVFGNPVFGNPVFGNSVYKYSKYIITVIDLDEGEIVESILKIFEKDNFKQDLESFVKDVYPESKIIFENENVWLLEFLKANFETYLYKSETIFYKRPYGWVPSKSIFDSFRTNIPEIDLIKMQFGSLYFFFDKSRGML